MCVRDTIYITSSTIKKLITLFLFCFVINYFFFMGCVTQLEFYPGGGVLEVYVYFS